MSITIQSLLTTWGNAFKSGVPTEISKLILASEKIEIKPSSIQLPQEIKSLGKFKIKINLHTEVQAEADIEVLAAESIQ